MPTPNAQPKASATAEDRIIIDKPWQVAGWLGIINGETHQALAVWPSAASENGGKQEPICLVAPLDDCDEKDEETARILAMLPDLVRGLRSVANNNAWHPSDKNTRSGTVAIDCDVIRYVWSLLARLAGESNVLEVPAP